MLSVAHPNVISNLLRHLVRREDGQDLIEYALLVGSIALVAVAAISSVGQGVNVLYGDIDSHVQAIPGARDPRTYNSASPRDRPRDGRVSTAAEAVATLGRE